jgi:hypothetical protein
MIEACHQLLFPLICQVLLKLECMYKIPEDSSQMYVLDHWWPVGLLKSFQEISTVSDQPLCYM